MKLFSPFRFLLHYNFLVSLAAAMLGIETRILLKLNPVLSGEIFFLFFATLTAYQIYYFDSVRHPLAKFFLFPALILSIMIGIQLPAHSQRMGLLISILSIIYTLPVFVKSLRMIRKPGFKMVLLTIIWTLASFIFPAENMHLSAGGEIILTYRVAFLFFLILIFNLEGREFPTTLQWILLPILPLLLMLLSVYLIWLRMDVLYALACMLSTLLCFVLHRRAIRKQHAALFYLFYADGLMVLHSIFVLILKQGQYEL
jgi:hypothetical protein